MVKGKFRLWSTPDDSKAGLVYWCQGCESPHTVQTLGVGPQWSFNGDYDKPVVSPSVLVTYPANPDASEEFKEWRTERRCHTFIGCNGATPGEVIFLSDCTHALAGTVQPLLDLPKNYQD